MNWRFALLYCEHGFRGCDYGIANSTRPAPEVRAIMNARSLFKASCKQKEQLTKQQEEELRKNCGKS